MSYWEGKQHEELVRHNELIEQQNKILERIAHAMEFHWGIIRK